MAKYRSGQVIFVLQAIFLITQINCYEFHLERARDIWQGVGQAFKYRSTFRLINKKFQQKGGMIGSVERFYGKEKWELMAKLKMDGSFRNAEDGVAFWINNVSHLKEYDMDIVTSKKNIGATKKYSGVYIFISPDYSKKRVNIYFNNWKKQREVTSANLSQMTSSAVTCSFNFDDFLPADVDPKSEKVESTEMPTMNELTLILKFNTKSISQSFLGENDKDSSLCGVVDAGKNYNSFFLSMSAYSEKPSTVEVRGLFFTSQEENEHLTFWPSESDHHAPELFRNIHYLKAMKDDPSNQLIKPSQNIVSPEQWEKSSKKIIEKLYKMQEESQHSLSSGDSQLEMSMGELDIILKYLMKHHDVSKDYYKSLINTITKYLIKSGKQFTYMGEHIAEFVNKLEKIDLNNHLETSQKLVLDIQSGFDDVKAQVKAMAKSTNLVKDHLTKGIDHLKNFESKLKELPTMQESITSGTYTPPIRSKNLKNTVGNVAQDILDKQKLNIPKIFSRATTYFVYMLLVFVLVIGVAFALMVVLINNDSNDKPLL